jgi:hypothetical protein
MQKSAIIIASLLLSSPVLAQAGTANQLDPNYAQGATDNQTDWNSSSAQAQNTPSDNVRIADKIKSHLEQVGFQNVKLMPGSFIVRAEDQNHNPVMMVINPDSITAIHAMNLGSDAGDHATVGQSAGSLSGNDQAASQNCR